MTKEETQARDLEQASFYDPDKPLLYRLGSVIKSNWPVWLISLAALVNGLANIVFLLVARASAHTRLFGVLLPFGSPHWGRTLTLILGFSLVYLSFQLIQKRRIAWWLALIASILAVLAHIDTEHYWYMALPHAVTGGLLLLYYRKFTVRSDTRSLSQGIALTALCLIIALTYGTLGFWLLDKRDFLMTFHPGDALIRTLRELVFIGNSDLVARTHHAHWFLMSLHILSIVAVSLAIYSLFRPLAYKLRTKPHESKTAMTILNQHGRSALDYFKIWPDKSYFFSKDHKCFIAYKTCWSVAFSLGDPVGPQDDLEDIIRGFIRFSGDNGWDVVFHQVLPDLIPLYRKLDLNVLKIGEEAIIDLEHFQAETSQRKQFRYIRRKFEGEGYALMRYLPPHDPALLDEVEEISNEWLSLPGRRERGFTLGCFTRKYLNETPIFVLRDKEGRAVAFVNEIPSYRQNEANIDLMRHRVEIPNGVMDFLFLKLMLELKEQGYLRFNFGLAPFAGVGEQPGATLQERAVRQVSERLNRFFSYKGMRHYKSKFDPLWEDRFIVYQGGPLGLLKVAIALTRVSEA